MDKYFPRNESLKFGWETAKKNIKFFIPILVVIAFINIVASSIDNSFPEDATVPRFLFTMIMWVVGAIVSVGLIRTALAFVDSHKPNYNLFYPKVQTILYFVASSILYGLAVGVGLILLVIPGIYLALRLQFFSYLIIEKGSGPIEALKQSWRITDGFTWKLFVFGLIVTGINILGALVFLVGLVWTVPMTQIATAYIYRRLSDRS
jgi:hypothetical protein